MVLALPFAVGLVLTGRRLGRELAERALPAAGSGLDLAQAPRRAMARLLEVVVAVVAISLFVTATQPVLPAGWSLGVLAVALLAILRAFWKTSDRLDGHVRAGAQAFAEALLAPHVVGSLEEFENLLPGLGDLTEHAVPADSTAVGKSLAELDLRGRTGATVLVVRRGETVRELPGADWRIEADDVLGLTGSHDAIALARELVLGPEAESAAAASPD